MEVEAIGRKEVDFLRTVCLIYAVILHKRMVAWSLQETHLMDSG